jgi:uncharacterized protein (DUF58 family)
MRAAVRRWRSALWHELDRRLPNLTRRHRFEPLPIALNQRRIYIVPSGFGLLFAAMLFAILAGALNYNNNGALLFGLLPVSLAVVSMHQTFFNLNRLQLVQVHADPVFCGEQALFSFHFRADDGRARFGVSGRYGEVIRHIDIAPGATCAIEVPVMAAARGWLSPEPLRVSTVWPFGLFFAWSYLHSQARTLIYPRPETPAAPLPKVPDPGRLGGADPGDEELRSLRDYAPGDSPRMIAWKASARTGDLLVRQLEVPRARETVLDFERIVGLDLEQKLSRLTRWVIDADSAGLRYRLDLPGQRLGPDTGSAHRLRCLKSLALYALPGS